VAGVAGIFTSLLLKNTRSAPARNKKMHVDEYFFSLGESTCARRCASCGQREAERFLAPLGMAAVRRVDRLAYAKLRPLVARNFDVETL